MKARRLFWIGITGFFFCLLMQGCAPFKLISAEVVLNEELDYLPWEDNTLELSPGMRLEITQVPLYPQGANHLVAPISRYELVIPRAGQYDRGDFLFFRYCAGMSEGEAPLYLDREIDSKLRALDENNFSKDLATQLLDPFFQSIQLEVNGQDSNPAPKFSAEAIRRKLKWGTKSDVEIFMNHSHRLACSIISDEKIYLFNNDDWFFRKNITSRRYGGTWFPSDNGSRLRSHIEVGIPVRFWREHQSRFVPVYQTVADLEKRYGLKVRVLRRSIKYLENLKDSGGQYIPLEKIAGRDGYGTLYFGKGYKTWGASKALDARAIDKDVVLLAPGDLVIFHQKRNAVTDSPGSR